MEYDVLFLPFILILYYNLDIYYNFIYLILWILWSYQNSRDGARNTK